MITAKTFGTEYDPESFFLPEQNVIVTKHNFSKASAILTWSNADDLKHDLELEELKSSNILADIEYGEPKHQGGDVEIWGPGSQTLENDTEFQSMLEDDYCGDIFDYCLNHGKDCWDAIDEGLLPDGIKSDDLPEMEYEGDRIPIYDIKVTWDDGSSDLFVFFEDGYAKHTPDVDSDTKLNVYETKDKCINAVLKTVSSKD